MKNLVFVKLGGSLITDKTQRYAARTDVIERLAQEIAGARRENPALKIVVGHGSGSFGHVAAAESGYNPKVGHPSFLALAKVGAAASALNHIVRDALLAADLPVLSVAPSTAGHIADGKYHMRTPEILLELLYRDMIPLVYGDVALRLDAESKGGGIASTEMVFEELAHYVQPERLLQAGVVDGVFAEVPHPGKPRAPIVHLITPDNWAEVRQNIGGSHGTDVTGGMFSKVEESLHLVEELPHLDVHIFNGETPGLLERMLLNAENPGGTRIAIR